jgi:hypothetical protein
MTVNIEDAGFEIRDQIMWIYGSGFPKSHNIGKSYDKKVGNEREVIGTLADINPRYKTPRKGGDKYGVGFGESNEAPILDKGSSQWEGWGTALKPAQEIIAVAQKPENLEGTVLNLIYNIKNELWKLYVKIVEQSSELNQVAQKEVLDIAQCLVEKNTNIQDALQGVMDMSQLRLMENMNWNIVLLWHNILEDLYQKMSKYTTSTKSNLIIDLKTLKSLEWQNILESITQVKDNQIDGLSVNALTAVVLFNALNLKLKDIQQHSVEDNVIYKEDNSDCLNEPICVARKPLSEKTIVDNVIKWGVGGINIDGCRIKIDGVDDRSAGIRTGNFGDTELTPGGNGTEPYIPNEEGRFPANIIFDETAAAMLDEQQLGASRFFYVPKVSKKERNMGLDGFEDKIIEGRDEGQDELNVAYKKRPTPQKNTHPTLKPINLMNYLCRLVTPPGGIVLDPFMGSGSTGISACLEGFRFVGMELDEDYFKIAEARINSFEEYRQLLKQEKNK